MDIRKKILVSRQIKKYYKFFVDRYKHEESDLYYETTEDVRLFFYLVLLSINILIFQ